MPEPVWQRKRGDIPCGATRTSCIAHLQNRRMSLPNPLQPASPSRPPPVIRTNNPPLTRLPIYLLAQVIAALALGQFPLSTSSTSTDHMFDLIQAITEDPVPALSPQSFSPELCDLVELMLRRDPGERPTAVKLLTHPFLLRHQDQDSVALAGMVKVSPASPTEVRTFLRWCLLSSALFVCCRAEPRGTVPYGGIVM